MNSRLKHAAGVSDDELRPGGQHSECQMKVDCADLTADGLPKLCRATV
jgi:hypothetical protein